MGEYRNRSPLWRKTCKNRLLRGDVKAGINEYNGMNESFRRNKVCYSHEYIGNLVHRS
jgi:hypothetical protein